MKFKEGDWVEIIDGEDDVQRTYIGMKANVCASIQIPKGSKLMNYYSLNSGHYWFEDGLKLIKRQKKTPARIIEERLDNEEQEIKERLVKISMGFLSSLFDVLSSMSDEQRNKLIEEGKNGSNLKT